MALMSSGEGPARQLVGGEQGLDCNLGERRGAASGAVHVALLDVRIQRAGQHQAEHDYRHQGDHAEPHQRLAGEPESQSAQQSATEER